MADRTTIYLDCPGSLRDATVIAEFPAAVFGVGNPANTGEYPLSIGALDKNGKLLNPRHPLALMPGQSARWYHAPANTFQIVAAGWSNAVGQTSLEFDTPEA
jgi:hypothetical protein